MHACMYAAVRRRGCSAPTSTHQQCVYECASLCRPAFDQHAMRLQQRGKGGLLGAQSILHKQASKHVHMAASMHTASAILHGYVRQGPCAVCPRAQLAAATHAVLPWPSRAHGAMGPRYSGPALVSARMPARHSLQPCIREAALRRWDWTQRPTRLCVWALTAYVCSTRFFLASTSALSDSAELLPICFSSAARSMRGPLGGHDDGHDDVDDIRLVP